MEMQNKTQPSPINCLVPCSYITKELTSNVIEQFKDLVNWLKEIRLKGQAGTKRTDFRFKEGERETWLTPLEETLELAKVMKWWFLGKRKGMRTKRYYHKCDQKHLSQLSMGFDFPQVVRC